MAKTVFQIDTDVLGNLDTVFAKGQTGNFTLTIPANAIMLGVEIAELAGNSITGGINIGTTANGNDIVNGYTISANQLTSILDNSMLKRWISMTAPTTIYFSAKTAWNNAKINAYIRYQVHP